MRQHPGPVTADDVDLSVQLALAALRTAPEEGWQSKAGPLEWDCWETVEHLADDLFAYAGQLGPKRPPLDRYVPFALHARRPGGPENTTHAELETGVDGLLEMLDACGALLVAMVRTAAPEVRGYHGWGVADAEGFAAMGIVETLVHVDDIAVTLGVDWDPPQDICDRVLYRLFPDTPTDTDRWQTLLWATGRAELPGHERVGKWRWYGAPR